MPKRNSDVETVIISRKAYDELLFKSRQYEDSISGKDSAPVPDIYLNEEWYLPCLQHPAAIGLGRWIEVFVINGDNDVYSSLVQD